MLSEASFLSHSIMRPGRRASRPALSRESKRSSGLGTEGRPLAQGSIPLARCSFAWLYCAMGGWTRCRRERIPDGKVGAKERNAGMFRFADMGTVQMPRMLDALDRILLEAGHRVALCDTLGLLSLPQVPRRSGSMLRVAKRQMRCGIYYLHAVSHALGKARLRGSIASGHRPEEKGSNPWLD